MHTCKCYYIFHFAGLHLARGGEDEQKGGFTWNVSLTCPPSPSTHVPKEEERACGIGWCFQSSFCIFLCFFLFHYSLHLFASAMQLSWYPIVKETITKELHTHTHHPAALTTTLTACAEATQHLGSREDKG